MAIFVVESEAMLNLEEYELDVLLKAVGNVDVTCYRCARLHKNRITCEAFPSGIPAVLKSSQVRHDSPYRGDNGIRFKAKSGDNMPSGA